MILWLLLFIFAIGFFVAVFCDWPGWVSLFCLFGTLACLIILAFQEAAEPVVISTAISPQIDTTITYSNGVADTVYTYHIIKMK